MYGSTVVALLGAAACASTSVYERDAAALARAVAARTQPRRPDAADALAGLATLTPELAAAHVLARNRTSRSPGRRCGPLRPTCGQAAPPNPTLEYMLAPAG